MLRALRDDLQRLVQAGATAPAHEIVPEHEQDEPEHHDDIEDEEAEELRSPPGGELRQPPLRQADDDMVQVAQGEEDRDGGQHDEPHEPPRLAIEVVREEPPRHHLQRVDVVDVGERRRVVRPGEPAERLDAVDELRHDIGAHRDDQRMAVIDDRVLAVLLVAVLRVDGQVRARPP